MTPGAAARRPGPGPARRRGLCWRPMEVPCCCPRCGAPFRWELSLELDREIAWQAPHAPAFAFRCQACDAAVELSFRWALERGDHPRPLRVVGGPAPQAAAPGILLVHPCPHGCGQRLGLQLSADLPWAQGVVWPDEDRVIGGFRCPRCDGEGRLRISPRLEPSP